MIRILTICTGNICRSPLAAKLLQSRLPADRFQITSAGTSVIAGEGCTEETLRVARDLGLSGTEDHRAKTLTSEAVANADLILGMERVHRRVAARSHPAAAKRSYTLMEFAQIAAQVNDEQLRLLTKKHVANEMAALVAAARMRGVVPRLVDRGLYDVEDPYGRSYHVYQRTARQLASAVERIGTFLERVTQLYRTFSDVTSSDTPPHLDLQLHNQKQETGQK